MKVVVQKACFLIGTLLMLIGVINTGTEWLYYNSLWFPLAGAFLILGMVKPFLKVIGLLITSLFLLLFIHESIQTGFYFGMVSFSIFMTLIYATLMVIGALIYKCFSCLLNHSMTLLKRSSLGVIGVCLLLWMMASANTLIGNPLTAFKATKMIEEYVSTQYPNEWLLVKEASYSFDTQTYECEVYHDDNEDLNFLVSYRNGSIVSDTYESTVLSYFNTIRRLSAQYSKLVNELLNETLELKENTSYVYYDFDAVDYMSKTLELGMEFDETLPISAQVTLQFELENQSLDELSELIVTTFKLFEEAGYYFDLYHLTAYNEKEKIIIQDVTPKDIESGQLASRIEAGLANVSAYGIKTIKMTEES